MLQKDLKLIDLSKLTLDNLRRYYNINFKTGYIHEEVRRMHLIYGFNELKPKPAKKLIKLIKEQFDDHLVRILLFSAFISFFLSYIDHDLSFQAITEPVVILLILVANAIVGITQERKAEKSLDALKNLQSDNAMVFRNNSWKNIDARNLVPGDIIQCKTGDKIPADCRVFECNSAGLKIKQSELTGESYLVSKSPGVVEKAEDIQSLNNILFASTVVASGKCKAIVLKIGEETEIGKIHAALMEDETAQRTPLAKKLDEFGSTLSKLIALICLIVWLMNIRNFKLHGGYIPGCIYYLKIAIALAVAAIPEGLPAVITTCLALGTKRMVKRNAIVRKLSSVESLGCTTVICSDKTGTLTTGMMAVTEFCTFNADEANFYAVNESNDTLNNTIVNKNSKNHFISIQKDQWLLKYFAATCALCNESKLIQEKNDKIDRYGDPTEIALRILVEKMKYEPDTNEEKYFDGLNESNPQRYCDFWANMYKLCTVFEFTRSRKSMSALVQDVDGNHHLFVKGAPENILMRSNYIYGNNGKVFPLTPEISNNIVKYYESLADNALRTLALAIKLNVQNYDNMINEDNLDNFITYEQDMIFIGVIGIMDPPRKEVKDAIQNCKKAGIRIIMITGDHKCTAESIAKKINICVDSEGKLMQNNSITGYEYSKMSINQIKVLLSSYNGAIISRADPSHKLDIVNVLKELDEIVAMTGDGVNDAPALKQSDVGIAMGKSGTEVAKQASDVILADDNFATIVAAIEEGRSIYNNMKCFIRYLISSNIGEVVTIFLCSALSLPEAFLPIQLLWVNLVTDGPPATALSFNKPESDTMRNSPRKSDQNLIDIYILIRYLCVGLFLGFSTVGIFLMYFISDTGDGHPTVTLTQLRNHGKCAQTGLGLLSVDELNACNIIKNSTIKASTLALTVLVMSEMFNAFNSLSETSSLLCITPLSNKYLLIAIATSILIHMMILYIGPLAAIFRVTPLSLHEWVLVIVFSSPIIIIDEIIKYFIRTKKQFFVSKIGKKTHIS